jgi:hypothetical protein
MKKVLLIGCGSEIGASLLSLSEPEIDGFSISDIITSEISSDPKHPQLTGLDSLITRIIIANPNMLDSVKADYNNDIIIVKGKKINIHWGDATIIDLNKIKQKFDVAILATSKEHISNPEIITRFLNVSKYVIGVAEGPKIPSLYVNLIGIDNIFLDSLPEPAGDNRCFVIGSCQTNGWQAQLRPLLELSKDFANFEVCGLEVDIIHPDTPTGRLGTKSISARNQDPRNNLRPSFSQIEMAMDYLFPFSNNVNTISLRTLIHPPGYQISRFFFKYQTRSGKRLTRDTVLNSYKKTAKNYPDMVRMGDLPFGSRGYENCESAAVILASKNFFRFFDDPFKSKKNNEDSVSELIIQSYVHNVRGYCRSVINAIKYLIQSKQIKCFLPIK